MSMTSPIQSSLDSLSVRIATINDPSQTNPERFVIIQSELEALGRQITESEGNLAYLERFTTIHDQFRAACEVSQKQRAASSGMGSRSVKHSPSSQLVGSSRLGPADRMAPGIPISPEAQSTIGSINQWTDRSPHAPIFSQYNRNTCPCTSFAFISRFLNHGNTGLDSGMVDTVIRIGQDRYIEKIAERRRELSSVVIPPELRSETRGTMLAPGEAYGAFESVLGERPHSPKAFILVDLDPRIEGRLTGLLSRSIIDEAARQGGRVKVPLKVNGITFYALFEVTRDRITSSLCNVDGVPFPGTTSSFLKTARGIAMTSKSLIELMTTECRKKQLADFIQKSLVPLTEFHPSRRVASTITINGQIMAIGVEASGPRDNPTIRVTLFDSHGNPRLTGSPNGFVYQVEGVNRAADVLLRMMHVQKDRAIEIRGAVSEAQLKMIRGDIGEVNEVGSYIVLPREEHVSFGEAPVVARDSDVVGVGSRAHHQEEEEHKGAGSVVSSPVISREAQKEVPSRLQSGIGEQQSLPLSDRHPSFGPPKPIVSTEDERRKPPLLPSGIEEQRAEALRTPQPSSSPADQDPIFERRLTAGLSKSILPQAMAQQDGKILIPLTMKGKVYNILFEVRAKEIVSTLCSPEGIPNPETQNTFSNDEEGIARTAKALVGLMIAESKK